MKSACVGVLSIIELKNARWIIEIQEYLFDRAAARHSRKKSNLQPRGLMPTRRKQSRMVEKNYIKMGYHEISKSRTSRFTNIDAVPCAS